MSFGVFDIALWELCLLGALLLAFCYEVYFYARYMSISRKSKVESRKQLVESEEEPGVSVIVCARNEGYNLKPYIQSLLTQDYPLFEVIIVNDGSEDNTQAVIDEYTALDKRVKTTFVPCGARVRSTKKLGLTLAAKAAQYDYLLLTDADCRPESVHWISEMVAPLKQSEIALGYGAYFKFNGLHFLGAAATGKPYMGVGRNLAYRKDTFFANGGFSHQMNACAGDDDLFVNKVANKHNTAAVYSRDSVTWSVPKTTWKSWWQQKRRHLSVSDNYKPSTKRHLLREPMARGVFYALFIALMIIGSPLVMTAAFALMLLRLGLQLIMLNIGADHFQQPRVGLELIWYDMLLPVVTGCIMLLPKKKDW